MKKRNIYSILYILLAAALLLPLLASCGEETPPEVETTTEEVTEPVEELQPVVYAGGEHEYAIIRSDKASDEITDAALTLRASIQNKTKKDIALRTDLIAPKAGYDDTPYEIVVGETNRPETAEVLPTLLYLDYTICRKGTKIVILGGSDAATVNGVLYFISNLLSADGVFDGEDYIHRGTYPVSSIKINGTDVSDYTLVFPLKNSTTYADALGVLTQRVAQLCGIRMKTAAANADGTANEISIGDVGRGPATGETVGITEMMTAVSGSQIGILVDSIFASSALEYFVDKYLPSGSKGEINVTIPDGRVTEEVPRIEEIADGADMRMMTSNMLFDETLASRAPLIVKAYTGLLPDVVGIQECNTTGHSAVLNKLRGLYTSVGQTIAGTSSTCCTPIIFLTEKYNLIDSGTGLFEARWPKSDSKSYCWVVLERKSDGKRFAFLNAHWAIILGTYDTESVFGRKYTNGTEGAEWREDNSAVIIAKLREIREKYGADLPAFITGDMNASPTAKSVTMLAVDGMKNSIGLAKDKRTGLASFHNNPGQYPGSGNPIDNVFVTESAVTVFRHRLFETDLGISMSDHCAVYIDIKFN